MRDHNKVLLLGAILAMVCGIGYPSGVPSRAGVEEVQPASDALGETSPPGAATARYRIESGESRFIVRAFVGGLFSAFGHDHTIAIRDFSGEASFVPGTLEAGSLQMTVRTASLAVTDKVSEKDRREIESTMREKVLETDKYPEIVFKSTNISANRTGEGEYQAKIWGALTLHGVTRNGLIYAKVTLNGSGLRARGEFPLRQTEYKITPVSIAAGTIKVKDELKLSFDVAATKL